MIKDEIKEKDNRNLKQKTIHGLKWSYFSTISNAVMQIGYTAVMARLLEPAAFGLVAMAQVVLRFGSYFAQMGMGQALIQKKELSNENIRAAFTVSVGLGIVFFTFIYILAPLSTYIFNDEKVIPIIRIMALSFVFTGLSTTALSLLRRNFRFKILAIIEIASYIIGYIGVGITLALLGYGVWSLVFAALTQTLLKAFISYLFVKHSLLLVFNWQHYKKLLSFGSKVSLISFLEFIRASIDTIFIGKFFSATDLGYYNRGYRLINLPLNFLTISSARVIYPAFSRIQTNTEKLKENYLKITGIILQVLLPIAIIAIIFAKQIVTMILGPKWLDSIPIFQLLAIPSALILVANIGSMLCEAIAELKIKIIITITSISIILIFFAILKDFNIIGVAISMGCGWSYTFLAYLLFVKRRLKIKWINIFYAVIPSIFTIISILIFTFFIYYFKILYNPQNKIIEFLIFIINLFIIIALTIFSPFKYIRKEISNILKYFFKK